MSERSRVTDPAFRVEYRSLFMAAGRLLADGVFGAKHRPQMEAWSTLALLANQLHTDDSYAFTRAANEVKAMILALPEWAEPELPSLELPSEGATGAEGTEEMSAEERAAAREQVRRQCPVLRASRGPPAQ